MNLQKVLLASLAGTVVFFIAGFVIWGLALDSIQKQHMTSYEGLVIEPMPNMVYLVLAQFFAAFLIAYIFNKWAGIKTFVTGAKAGALIAVLMGLVAGFMNLAMFNLMDLVFVLCDFVGNIFWGAIGGGVIAWVLGRGESS